MRNATAGFAVALFAVVLALPAQSAELGDVEVASVTMHQVNGRWLLDLGLTTTNHPGTVRVSAWRHDFTRKTTWTVPNPTPGKTETTTVAGIYVGQVAPRVAGDTEFGPHAVSAEWDADGTTWRRTVWVHRTFGNNATAPGAHYVTAGEGSAVPWWLRCEFNAAHC